MGSNSEITFISEKHVVEAMCCLQIIWRENRGFRRRSFHMGRTWFKLAVTSSNQFLPAVAHDK